MEAANNTNSNTIERWQVSSLFPAAVDSAYRNRVYQIVFKAITEGQLIRPNNCSVCDCSDCRINAHHNDYTKPLEVRWLCDSCHRLLHNGNISDSTIKGLRDGYCVGYQQQQVYFDSKIYQLHAYKIEPYKLAGLLKNPDIVSEHTEQPIDIDLSMLSYRERDMLSYREREVIKMNFGLDGTPLSMSDIAHVLRVTRERVRQIRQKTLRKLRKAIDSQL